MLGQAFSFIANNGHVLSRLAAHLGYSAAAVLVAVAIALPLGLFLGHTRILADSITAFTGALRAVPSLGLMTWLALELSFGLSLPAIPGVIVLVVLAIPPILAGTVSGLVSVPRSITDSARAAGFSELHIVRGVEVPLAAQSIVGGIRSAAVQVIATTTIVAYIGLSGLGRYLIDGLAIRDYPQMLAGAILVAALAITVDLIFAIAQRLVRPKGTSS